MKYFYVVNTFDCNMNPIQVSGTIEGSSEKDVINKLIECGMIYSKGYEFLELVRAERF